MAKKHRVKHDSVSSAVYTGAAGLGFVAGLRSQLPLALLALESGRGRCDPGSTAPLRLLHSPVTRRVLGLAALRSSRTISEI